MRPHPMLIAAIALSMIAATVKASSITVEQSGQQFSDKLLSLAAGDGVTFANHDDVTHNINVIDSDDEAVDLGLQKPGQSLTYKFDKAGRFRVRCSIHPGMKMSINVK